MNYHDFTVDELRSAARSKGLKGAKVVFMKKDELIYFLETGAIIETVPETKAPETTPAADILAEYETALLKGYSVEIELLCAAKLMNSKAAKILKVTGLNVFDLSVFHFVLANVSFARAAVYPYKYILNGEKYFNSKIIAGIDKKELKETFDGGSIFYGALLRGKYIKEVFDGENWVTLNN